jgi:indolepyruvate ferredoxin oxidoreductase
MAAHIEGKGIVTQDAAGLAQKGGATWSHILIAQDQSAIATTRVGMGGADLIIGCDPIVTASKETMLRMREGRTHVALNAHSAPTAAFVHNGNWQNPGEACIAEVTRVVGVEGVGAFNADAAANKLMGDSIYINPMILGYAWQRGWLPLGHASLMRAIELNGVAVEQNKAAFQWGRRAAHDGASVERLFEPAQVVTLHRFARKLEDIVASRAEFLTGYQDAAYARQYQAFVGKVRDAEAALGKTQLAEAVARYLFKLMAYKDEYEVARLHTDTAFLDKVNSMFEGDFKLGFNLAPPLLARRNHRGELQKSRFGAWMLGGFRLLARLKGLRGGALDVFGYSAERRTERALIVEYRSSIERALASLTAQNHASVVELARVPELIKGYGHVKERHLLAARAKWVELEAALQAGTGQRRAA